MRLIAAMLAVCALASGADVGQSRIGTAASEQSCQITHPTGRVDTSDAQVFVQFTARSVRPGDKIRVDWVDPQGAVSSSANYEELPASPALCFLSALPVGGFAPSTKPGQWRAVVSVNGRAAHEHAFVVAGASSGLSVRVVRFDEKEIVLDTTGAGSETSINIAQYTPKGGWEYILHVLPEQQDGNRITLKSPQLAAAEYLIILRNPDGRLSPPARFVISSRSGYQMPVLAQERWRISQGPYGSYSHFGRALHAYDVAPIGARWVAAMRAGTVAAYDLGLGQTPHRRIFGNYISIRHDDGEYSHYAHLRTGSFQVRTGDRVEAGEPLAEVGNSGYSFGRHVHVHVTRSASISAQSVPFKFGDPQRPSLLTHQTKQLVQPALARQTPRWTGELGFSAWWNRLLTVPRGARSLDVKLGWEGKDSDFDLYLVSPSGRSYRDEGEVLHIESPEAGQWRVAVQAVRGQGNALSFWVEPEVSTGKPKK